MTSLKADCAPPVSDIVPSTAGSTRLTAPVTPPKGPEPLPLHVPSLPKTPAAFSLQYASLPQQPVVLRLYDLHQSVNKWWRSPDCIYFPVYKKAISGFSRHSAMMRVRILQNAYSFLLVVTVIARSREVCGWSMMWFKPGGHVHSWKSWCWCR